MSIASFFVLFYSVLNNGNDEVGKMTISKEDLARNLRRIMAEKGITENDIVQGTHLDQASVNRWINARSMPRPEKMQILANFLGLPTMDYLLGKAVVAGSLDKNISFVGLVRQIPIISMVQAGNWTEICEVDTFDDWVAVNDKCSSCSFAVRVRGISMQNKESHLSFDDGDIVIADPERPAVNGSLVIVRLEDSNEATFKQLHIEDGKQYLVPLNPQWQPQIIEVTQNAVIVGVVFQKIVRF